jgi:hypothetical protein
MNEYRNDKTAALSKDCTNPGCRRIDGKCVGPHCPRCGEPCGPQGHACSRCGGKQVAENACPCNLGWDDAGKRIHHENCPALESHSCPDCEGTDEKRWTLWRLPESKVDPKWRIAQYDPPLEGAEVIDVIPAPEVEQGGGAFVPTGPEEPDTVWRCPYCKRFYTRPGTCGLDRKECVPWKPAEVSP